jgi:hypothetical protein
MLECALCGKKYISKDEFDDYSYDRFLHEVDKRNLKCCKTCQEILRSQGRKHLHNKKVIKVRILTSDYPIPGFILSKDGSHYKRPNKKHDGRVMRYLGRRK